MSLTDGSLASSSASCSSSSSGPTREIVVGGIPMEVDADDKEMMLTADEQSSTQHLSQDLSPPFRVEDRVYAPDQTTSEDANIYEAIVRKARANPETHEWSFLVHYQGWNARWDRWIPAAELHRDTPENRVKYEQQQSEKKRKSSEQQQQQPRSTRRKLSSNMCSRSIKQYLYSDYCELPFTLKTVMVDEFDKITRRGWDSKCHWDAPYQYSQPARMVHCLPASVPIRKVLSHFRKKKLKALLARQASNDENSASRQPSPSREDVELFCKQLAQLFESTLLVVLLYPEERPQFEELKKSGVSWMDVCGCEYLLRLYVRLPVLLQAERHSIDVTRSVVGPLLAELLVLIQKNKQALFPTKGNYRPLEPDEWTDWEKEVYHPTEKQAPSH